MGGTRQDGLVSAPGVPQQPTTPRLSTPSSGCRRRRPISGHGSTGGCSAALRLRVVGAGTATVAVGPQCFTAVSPAGAGSSQGLDSIGLPTLQASLSVESPPQTVGGAKLVGGRSECWEAFSFQREAASSTGVFVFAQRRLDALTALALAQYLRDDCRARFVELTSLERWEEVALSIAKATRYSLRATRSLVIDGNNIAYSADVLEAWCQAVEEHPGLQHLSLRDVGLDDRSARRLAEALHGHSVLFSVDVSYNRLGDAGVIALARAVAASQVLLEIDVSGTDASDASRAELADAMARNAARVCGPRVGTLVLQDLRRAYADAQTASSKLAARKPLAAKVTYQPAEASMANQASSAAGAESEDNSQPRGTSGEVLMEPSRNLTAVRGSTFFEKSRMLPTARGCRSEQAEGEVFFDAPDRTFAELAQRCEAGWRYNASDREYLCELRREIETMRAHRVQERNRAEETLDRIAVAAQAAQQKLVPAEERILALKEELAKEVEATKAMLVENIHHKVVCRQVMEELEGAQSDTSHCLLNAQKAESDLTLRYQEVMEGASKLQQQLSEVERRSEEIQADNKRCRKLLHASRFETETERFGPTSTCIALATVPT